MGTDVKATNKATPRPWKAIEEGNGWTIRAEADRHGIAFTNNGACSTWATKQVLDGLIEREANAALIVEAVNAYDALREENAALREVLKRTFFYLGGEDAARYGHLAQAQLIADTLSRAIGGKP